jgi:hypothetical protein
VQSTRAVAGVALQAAAGLSPRIAVIGEIPDDLATIPCALGYLGLISSGYGAVRPTGDPSPSGARIRAPRTFRRRPDPGPRTETYPVGDGLASLAAYGETSHEV